MKFMYFGDNIILINKTSMFNILLNIKNTIFLDIFRQIIHQKVYIE